MVLNLNLLRNINICRKQVIPHKVVGLPASILPKWSPHSVHRYTLEFLLCLSYSHSLCSVWPSHAFMFVILSTPSLYPCTCGKHPNRIKALIYVDTSPAVQQMLHKVLKNAGGNGALYVTVLNQLWPRSVVSILHYMLLSGSVSATHL